MTDTLRDRIADTIAISLFGSIGTIRRTDALRAADRVMRDLMEREHIQYGDGHSMGVAYRYVTEWEKENELMLSERGEAVVESGLTVRQSHEIRTGCSPDSPCEKCRKEAE